jgi:serine/threonine protein kinase
LEALHKRDYFHGDLKLDNLIFRPAPEGSDDLTVIDFNSVGKVGEPYNMCQAPEYRAPEVILKSPVGTKSDIWSSAALLFEVILKEPLFPACSPRLMEHALIRDAQRLHQICKLIGMPSEIFLKTCQGPAKELFKIENGEVSFKPPLRAVDVEEWERIEDEYNKYFGNLETWESWKKEAKQDPAIESAIETAYKAMASVYLEEGNLHERLLAGANNLEFSEERLSQIAKFLLEMLKYPESRLSASELLNNPIFQGIVFVNLSPHFGKHENTFQFYTSNAQHTERSLTSVVRITDRFFRSRLYFPTRDRYWLRVKSTNGTQTEIEIPRPTEGDTLHLVDHESVIHVYTTKNNTSGEPPEKLQRTH